MGSQLHYQEAERLSGGKGGLAEEVLVKLLTTTVEKILEKASKGKKLAREELSLLFLNQIYVETAKVSEALNHLTSEIKGFRSDLKPLIEAIAERIRKEKM